LKREDINTKLEERVLKILPWACGFCDFSILSFFSFLLLPCSAEARDRAAEGAAREGKRREEGEVPKALSGGGREEGAGAGIWFF